MFAYGPFGGLRLQRLRLRHLCLLGGVLFRPRSGTGAPSCCQVAKLFVLSFLAIRNETDVAVTMKVLRLRRLRLLHLRLGSTVTLEFFVYNAYGHFTCAFVYNAYGYFTCA